MGEVGKSEDVIHRIEADGQCREGEADAVGHQVAGGGLCKEGNAIPSLTTSKPSPQPWPTA